MPRSGSSPPQTTLRISQVDRQLLRSGNEKKVLVLMRSAEVDPPKHLRLCDHDAGSAGFEQPVLLRVACQRLDNALDHASVAAVRDTITRISSPVWYFSATRAIRSGGCTKVNPGCKFCYAWSRVSHRVEPQPDQPSWRAWPADSKPGPPRQSTRPAPRRR